MTRTLRSRLGGIIVALAALLGLGGCSTVKLGYQTLPEITYWWLDGYADFSDQQVPLVRAELSRLYTWHRTTELPKVVEVLARVEQFAAGNVTPQQVCAFVPEITARIVAVTNQVEPAVLPLIATIQPGQIRHLERKFQDRDDTWRREWLEVPRAEWTERRYQRLLDRFETVYGRLDDAQRVLLRMELDRSTFDPAKVDAERARRRQDIVQTIRRLQAPDLPATEQRTLLRGLLERMQQPPEAADRAWRDALVQENCRLVAVLHGSTSAEQRERALRRLRGWQRDLRELSAPR
ncbi:DUF6279 family lipoprotein [Ramlibacter sp.]|uniref:DUF6279 family lipoprotein n=1 Tax=Ramlibacter sp. TaxID=1917967 RepID=UPI0035B1FCF5